jgi:hypothetical protein
MLSGVSAHRLSAAGSWCLGIGMACVVAGVVLLGADQGFLAFLCLVPGAAGVTTARNLEGIVSTRRAREHAAGYITLVEGTGPADVEHVDPRTGQLVSFAGEDLTDDERRARIAAIRAHVRLGVGHPDRLLIATGSDPVDPVGHADEDLFAGRPRTFVTLPWTVRHGVVWGLMVVALAPLGFIAFAALEADPATRPAAWTTLVVVLATAAVAAVVMIVSMRKADRIMSDEAGGGRQSRGIVMSLWIVPLGIAVVLVSMWVAATNDIAGAQDIFGLAGLDRAAVMSAVWAVPWFLAWVVLTRRAATADLRSPA